MVVISPLDLRPTRMIVRLTREGRINLEFAMVPNGTPIAIPLAISANAIFTLSRPACDAPYHVTRARNACKSIIKNFRNSGENFQPRSLAVFLAFTAELLELGKNGTDVELGRLLLRLRGGGDLGFPARRCFGGRKQSCASIGR